MDFLHEVAAFIANYWPLLGLIAVIWLAAIIVLAITESDWIKEHDDDDRRS